MWEKDAAQDLLLLGRLRNDLIHHKAAWMDDGSTAVTLYTGGFSADGKSATVSASIPNTSTGKPTPLELRMSLGASGGHVTQLWGMGLGTTMFKMMELQYTRTKP